MKKKYFDPETEEMVSEDEIVARYFKRKKESEKKRFDWFRIYPKNISWIKEAVGSPRFAVILWILANLRYGDNRFSGSFQYIANGSGIPFATVRRVMEILQHTDCIRQDSNSEWMVNPAIIRAGDENFAAVQIDVYYSLSLKKYPRLNKPEVPVKPMGEQKEKGEDEDDFE